jgi:hypothetical protein
MLGGEYNWVRREHVEGVVARISVDGVRTSVDGVRISVGEGEFGADGVEGDMLRKKKNEKFVLFVPERWLTFGDMIDRWFECEWSVFHFLFPNVKFYSCGQSGS